MILYLAGNVGNQKYKESSMVLGGALNQLISYNDIINRTSNMELYYAGAEVWYQVLNDMEVTKQLASYHYMTKLKEKKIDSVFNRPRKIFIDSGGFSAFTQGAEINIDEYCDFIKKYNKHITAYAQLDVIGDEQGTQDNLEYMEKQGLKPLPVFHFKGDFKRLETLSNKYEYICLGGLVPLARRKDILKSHLDKCFKIIKNKCKVHGFGMTGIEILKRYPWYSVDSTSWIEAIRRGTYYEFKNGEMISLPTSEKKKATYKTIEYTGKIKGMWRVRLVQSIKEWLKLETYITKLWEKKGIKWDS